MKDGTPALEAVRERINSIVSSGKCDVREAMTLVALFQSLDEGLTKGALSIPRDWREQLDVVFDKVNELNHAVEMLRPSETQPVVDETGEFSSYELELESRLQPLLKGDVDTLAGDRWRHVASTALKESIEHWKRLRDNKAKPYERPDASSCACCFVWQSNPNHSTCNGCPIKLRTGKSSCDGTPYGSATNEYEDREENEFDGIECEGQPTPSMDAMVRFLQETLEAVESGELVKDW